MQIKCKYYGKAYGESLKWRLSLFVAKEYTYYLGTERTKENLIS